MVFSEMHWQEKKHSCNSVKKKIKIFLKILHLGDLKLVIGW